MGLFIQVIARRRRISLKGTPDLLFTKNWFRLTLGWINMSIIRIIDSYTYLIPVTSTSHFLLGYWKEGESLSLPEIKRFLVRCHVFEGVTEGNLLVKQWDHGCILSSWKGQDDINIGTYQLNIQSCRLQIEVDVIWRSALPSDISTTNDCYSGSLG